MDMWEEGCLIMSKYGAKLIFKRQNEWLAQGREQLTGLKGEVAYCCGREGHSQIGNEFKYLRSYESSAIIVLCCRKCLEKS